VHSFVRLGLEPLEVNGRTPYQLAVFPGPLSSGSPSITQTCYALLSDLQAVSGRR